MFFKILGVVLLGSSFMVSAAEGVSDEADKQIRLTLKAALPTLNITTIEKTPIDGLFEVSSSNEPALLVSSSGQYIVAGEIYQLEGRKITNISEQKRDVQRAGLIALVSEDEKMSFIPEGEVKAKITVFTDIDCGYCRKLHKEIPQLNAMGVQVDYLAYPRAGVGSSSYNKVVSAWCSDDPQAAMTKAKSGQVIPAKRCENPVASHLSLGRSVGVNGTPAIVLPSGKLLPGYAPANVLAKQLGVL